MTEFSSKHIKSLTNYVILAVLGISILFIPMIYSLPSCSTSLFPKIVGGNTDGDTYIHHIDVFDDYLAFCGDLYDSALSTINHATY